jgi:hypothetical protein
VDALRIEPYGFEVVFYARCCMRVPRIHLLGNWMNRWEDLRKAEGLRSSRLRAKVLKLRASLRPSVVATKEQEMGQSAQTQSRREASCCVVGGGLAGMMVGKIWVRLRYSITLLSRSPAQYEGSM